MIIRWNWRCPMYFQSFSNPYDLYLFGESVGWKPTIIDQGWNHARHNSSELARQMRCSAVFKHMKEVFNEMFFCSLSNMIGWFPNVSQEHISSGKWYCISAKQFDCHVLNWGVRVLLVFNCEVAYTFVVARALAGAQGLAANLPSRSWPMQLWLKAFLARTISTRPVELMHLSWSSNGSEIWLGHILTYYDKKQWVFSKHLKTETFLDPSLVKSRKLQHIDYKLQSSQEPHSIE